MLCFGHFQHADGLIAMTNIGEIMVTAEYDG